MIDAPDSLRSAASFATETTPRRPTPSRVNGAVTGLGILLGLFARDLGRAIAVGGAMLSGCVALLAASGAIPVGDWKLSAVASVTFIATAWICSRD